MKSSKEKYSVEERNFVVVNQTKKQFICMSKDYKTLHNLNPKLKITLTVFIVLELYRIFFFANLSILLNFCTCPLTRYYCRPWQQSIKKNICPFTTWHFRALPVLSQVLAIFPSKCKAQHGYLPSFQLIHYIRNFFVKVTARKTSCAYLILLVI